MLSIRALKIFAGATVLKIAIGAFPVPQHVESNIYQISDVKAATDGDYKEYAFTFGRTYKGKQTAGGKYKINSFVSPEAGDFLIEKTYRAVPFGVLIARALFGDWFQLPDYGEQKRAIIDKSQRV